MTIPENELNKIAELAYLDTNAHETKQLMDDVNTIMHYVEQLRQMDTTHVQPLRHPQDISARLRADRVIDENHVEALEKMAPLFIDGLYLVPKVIDTGS